MESDAKRAEDRTFGEARRRRLLPATFWTLVCAVVALTWPTWTGLVGVWSHQFGYSHGLLVAPLSAWLAWRALAGRSGGPIAPFPWMLVGVASVSFIWLFLRMASVRTLEEVAAVALLWTAATAVLGLRWGRVFLFPMGFLLFAVPVWEVLPPVLQPMTSVAAAALCDVLGIPTYLDGNIVHIPNGVFAIAQGCAGSHYFVSSITIAALFGHLEYRRWRSSLILVGLAALLAIVCNWLRVVVVIHAGYTSGMQHPWVKDHNMVGWALFTAGLIPLFFVARRLEGDLGDEVTQAPGATTVGEDAGPGRIAAVFAAALGAAAWPLGVELVTPERTPLAAVATVAAPAGQLGWRGPIAPDVDWTPEFLSADVQFRVVYEQNSMRITVFYAGYTAQGDGKEVISYDNRIEGREDWTPTEDTVLGLPGLGPWRQSILASPAGRRRVVFYRYAIAGRPTTSRLEAKIRQGWKGLSGNLSASILAVSTTCQDSCTTAGDHLVKFLSEMQIGRDVEGELGAQGPTGP